MKSIYQRLFETHGFSPAQKIIINLVNIGEVLEIGSSSGYMSKEFLKKGCLVDAIEIDPEAKDDLDKLKIKSFIGSIEDRTLQLKINKSYDYIICADVLEHLVDPEKVLIFLKSKLKNNGKIIISIPNVGFWDMRLNLFKGRFDYQESGLLDKTHLRFYTYNSFIELLKSTGFKIVKTHPAESRIPFEYTIKKIPILGNIILSLFKELLVNKFPNLTLYHYVVEAKK